MNLLLLGIELALALLGCWTLAYHCALALELPARAVAWPFLALLVPAFALLRGRARQAARDLRHESGHLAGVLGLGAALGAISLFVTVHTPDDFNFFHRALFQLGHLAEPFARAATGFDTAGLGAISPLHGLTSYEPGVALGAWLLGLDPLAAYHNATVFGANVLLAVVYVALLRQLGVSRGGALAGTALIFVFFFLESPERRGFGAMYRQLWLGRSLQWALLFPMLVLLSLRFLEAPGPRALVPVLLAGVCAIGLSGTGVFLVPGLIAALSLAGWAAAGGSLRAAPRPAALNLGSLYCIAIAALVLSGVLPAPVDLSVWQDQLPADWRSNLALSLGGAAPLARDACLLVVVPLLLLAGRERRFLLALVTALVVLFTNPFTGPLWIDAVQPGAYWRVAFLFPVPLCVGLLGAGLFALHEAGSRTPLRLAVVSLGLVAVVTSFALEARTASGRIGALAWKAPWQTRLPSGTARFARLAAPELAGRDVLAGQGMAWMLALLEPTARFEAVRALDTLHLFRNAGREAEGARRVRAAHWAGRCRALPAGAAAARESMARGVSALVYADCPGPVAAERASVLASAPGAWSQAVREAGWVLWLRED